MPKRLRAIVCGILVALVMVTMTSACVQEAEPEYAGSITEQILIAINENDYPKYSEHLDEAMKKAMPEAVFQETSALIKAKIGSYVSKEFWKAEDKGASTIVYYKAKFTGEPEDVIVTVVFQETAGRICVFGLWFDSPKLRR